MELVNWKGRTLLAVEVYPSALRPHWLKSLGIENGVLVRVGSTNRQADGPLTAELRRSALNLSYDEEPMPDINPDTLDVRVASGLFSRLREWNQNTAETLRLTIRYQGRLVPTVGGVLLYGKRREEFFPDAWIQCGRFDGTEYPFTAEMRRAQSEGVPNDKQGSLDYFGLGSGFFAVRRRCGVSG